MTTEVDERGLGPDQAVFEGEEFEDEPKTSLGFGGQTIPRKLKIGDALYLLMRCDVVSDGREKKKGDDGEFKYKAGASTTVLAELTPSQAAQVAADHG